MSIFFIVKKFSSAHEVSFFDNSFSWLSVLNHESTSNLGTTESCKFWKPQRHAGLLPSNIIERELDSIWSKYMHINFVLTHTISTRSATISSSRTILSTEIRFSIQVSCFCLPIWWKAKANLLCYTLFPCTLGNELHSCYRSDNISTSSFYLPGIYVRQ